MERPAENPEREVGRDEPQTPVHSLPSYNEPTAETHRRLTREEEAELALNRTTFAPGSRLVLIATFLVTIALVPLAQWISERRAGSPTVASELAKLLPHRAGPLLPHADTIKAAEKAIERDSVVSRWLLPRMQSLLTGLLGAGNEQAYVGRDGWLFYRPDVEYVTGVPFLTPSAMRRRTRSGQHPDSVRAIVEFRDDLAARGIELIVVPAAVKPTIEGDKLSSGGAQNRALQNASFDTWREALAHEHVRVFDPAPLLLARKQSANGAAQFLRTDTHWRPEAMEAVAHDLAKAVGVSVNSPAALGVEQSGVGDIAAMLKLPAGHAICRPETVTLHPVRERSGSVWRADPHADVLLLADSFANIYSLPSMGWGESAGFAEQLSRALGGHPLDAILRNSDGAFATRELLQHELAHGRDRLAGKRVVIWEFAARELAFGDWKSISLCLEQARPARFFTPRPAESVTVSGTVAAISAVPLPGSVPYKDHVMALHLVDLSGLTNAGNDEPAQALVYLWSMRDNIWAPAAHLRPGDRVRVRLQEWSEVSSEYEKFNRSEIDDPAVQLEEPAWGELLP